MKSAILKDQELQKQFDIDGYVKIQMLDIDTLNTLKEYSLNEFPENNNLFFSSSYLNDFDKKKKISDFVIKKIKKNLENTFIQYRTIGSALLIKGSGKTSEMPMHQDWTIVDETKYYALNLWIPLVETNVSNGCIEVIKGSHRWNEDVRAPTIPFFLDGHQERLKNELTQVPTTLGEIILLNQAVIHYSKPNYSNKTRPAITVGIVSKDAPLSIHYWDKNKPNSIEKIDQKDDFLLRFEDFHTSIFNRPVIGSLNKKIDYSKSAIRDDIKELLEPPIEKKKKGFLQTIFNRKS